LWYEAPYMLPAVGLDADGFRWSLSNFHDSTEWHMSWIQSHTRDMSEHNVS